MKENKPNRIYNFLTTNITDPTFLTAEFYIQPKSILFSKIDNNITSGDITSWDVNNSFLTQSDGLVVTPVMLLKNLDEKTRYAKFNNFISGFLWFVKYEQWRIQKIEGLDAVFAKEIEMKDGYTGSSTDKITITCLEDVNLSMYSLFNLYKECIYDYTNKRQILPNNILQFECLISIYDVRELIHYSDSRIEMGSGMKPLPTTKPTTAKFTYSGVESDARTEFEKGSHFIKPIIDIKLSNCHFDLSSLGKTVDNVSISEDFTASSFTFSFTYGKAFIERNYSKYFASENRTIEVKDEKYKEKQKAYDTNKYADSSSFEDTTGGVGKKSLGSKLSEKVNSKIDQFGNEIESKVNTIANAPKKAIEENVNKAIDKVGAAISEGIDSVAQQIEGKLTEAINTFSEKITDTAGKFTGFNIFENIPSGPKK